MSAEIELYKGDALVLHSSVPLRDVLAVALRPALGESATAARFGLSFHAIADPTVIEGPPRLVNLRSVLGYADVVAEVDGEVAYRHPHLVRSLLGPVLLAVVRRLDPEETSWGFCVSHPGLEDFALERPVPEVRGAVEVDGGDRRPRFSVRKLEEPELELRRPEELGIDPAQLGGVNILLDAAVHEAFAGGLPFSTEVENGGFLSGHVHRAAADTEQYLVRISNVTPAEHTGASLLHFTFTGDSFQAMNRVLAQQRPDEQLLGWYHTHLFPATKAMGLSSIDVELHMGTFRRPWQTAGLVNLARGRRVLRFYARMGDELKECRQWVSDERGRYSLARPVVGQR